MGEHPQNFKELFFLFKKFVKKILPPRVLWWYFSLYPTIGNFVFKKPSRKIKLIGITGTDGKSSTVIFMARILKEAGYKVGFSSSVFFSDGDKEYSNNEKMTMPGRFFMQKFLYQLVKNKCDWGVIEVTSEGIKQKRHLFIDFDVALVTNIKPEHIESHGGFDNYKNAKATIFKTIHRSFRKNIPKTIIVNIDDDEAKNFLSFSAEKKLTFSIRNHDASIRAEIIENNLTRNKFRVKYKLGSFITSKSPSPDIFWAEFIINSRLGGPFIVENALAAIVVAKNLGISDSICKSALEKIKVIPGRFETVSQKPFIIIDYAHTVAALTMLLSFVRKNWQGNIIHIFGAAGGGRDKWKRPRLAEISEKYTNLSILAEENSFDESTEQILKEIWYGFKNKDRIFIIPERSEAIQKGLELANKDSLILATGKGCETVIAGPLGRKFPYNDRDTILCLLSNT